MKSSERGVVMVIAALLMVTLLASTAMVVDVGRLYLAKKRLQTAADMAAIAGDFTLIDYQDPALADMESQKYLASNLPESFQYETLVDTSNGSVQVNVSQELSFYFAPIIGINSSIVRASATAAGDTIISITGVVPLGVVQQQFEFNQPYTLKYDGGDGQGGNYGALELGGTGGSDYRSNLMYGYKEEIRIGDILPTEPGNKAGPTNQGVNYRNSICHDGCDYLTHIDINCPRVVIVPIIDGIVYNGSNGQAKVVGFAAFFLLAADGNGDVTGVFLRWAVSGRRGEGPNFGLVSPTLIK